MRKGPVLRADPQRGAVHRGRDTLAFSAAHGILPEITTVGLRAANAALEAMAAGHAGNRAVITFD